MGWFTHPRWRQYRISCYIFCTAMCMHGSKSWVTDNNWSCTVTIFGILIYSRYECNWSISFSLHIFIAVIYTCIKSKWGNAVWQPTLKINTHFEEMFSNCIEFGTNSTRFEKLYFKVRQKCTLPLFLMLTFNALWKKQYTRKKELSAVLFVIFKRCISFSNWV